MEWYANDLVFDVIEVAVTDQLDAMRYRFKAGFCPEPGSLPSWEGGPVLAWPDFRLSVAVLEHHGPSLGFAVQEPLHVYIWKKPARRPRSRTWILDPGSRA